MENRCRMDAAELKAKIKVKSFELGFSLVGVCRPQYSPEDHDRMLRWLEKGYHGDMAYLEKTPRRRYDPRLFYNDMKSIVVVGANYYKKPGYEKTKPYISIYARGRPYQDVIRGKLESLLDYIKTVYPDADGKIAVDTSPTSDKLWGQLAGLGWRGKNTILINRKIGSFFFLGELFLNFELPFDSPEADHCADCHKCVDICPTGALDQPYILNADKCISYLTIEAKSPIAKPESIGNHVFGCDLCQLVCPFNKKAEETIMPELKTQYSEPEDDAFWQNSSAIELKNRYAGTVLTGYEFERIMNNMAIVRENIIHNKNGSLFAEKDLTS